MIVIFLNPTSNGLESVMYEKCNSPLPVTVQAQNSARSGGRALGSYFFSIVNFARPKFESSLASKRLGENKTILQSRAFQIDD